MKKNFLITGVAGFIGFSLALRLLKEGHYIFGLDNLDDYYSIKLKDKRLKELRKYRKFKFINLDIASTSSFITLKHVKINHIFHFAAQAGVRYSEINPDKYIKTNILGTINIFKYASKKKIKSIFFASSSSVYGDSKKFPLKESADLKPKNIYATTKLINEITAKSFSKYYNMKIIGLRFFTIFGEWGRPDMLLFKIFKSSLLNKKLELNNDGNHYRDFTYIEDVIDILCILINKKFNKAFNIFNICSNNPQNIKKTVLFFKKNLSSLKIKVIPKNKLDVYKTHGDNTKLLKFIKSYKFTDYKTAFKKTFKWYVKENKNLIF